MNTELDKLNGIPSEHRMEYLVNVKTGDQQLFCWHYDRIDAGFLFLRNYGETVKIPVEEIKNLTVSQRQVMRCRGCDKPKSILFEDGLCCDCHKAPTRIGKPKQQRRSVPVTDLVIEFIGGE